jgi:hypothetical protein
MFENRADIQPFLAGTRLGLFAAEIGGARGGGMDGEAASRYGSSIPPAEGRGDFAVLQ